MSDKPIPAIDPKTHRLLPPVTCSAGRCEWEYNDRGYQCPDQATQCSPCLMDGGRFKWWKLCDLHVIEAEKEMKPLKEKLALQMGGDPTKLRSNWRRIDQQNNDLRRGPPSPRKDGSA